MRRSLALIALFCAAGPVWAQSPTPPRPAPPPPESVAQPGRPGWSVDARNGCWVWALFALPGLTVTWSGACPHGPAEGRGQAEWRWMAGGQMRVGRFTGTFREGRANGRGAMTWPDGNRYEGEWRDGRANGQGIETWPNGDRYRGGYRDDRPEGHGAFYFAAERRWYRGAWADGCYRGADGRAAIGRPLSQCP